jgi:SAM-dependent methyltransferase
MADFDYKVIKEHLMKSISKGSRILDLYSYGNPLLYELWPYYKIVGIDANEELYNQKYYWKIHYIVNEISNINFPPNFFDAVTAIRLNKHTQNISSIVEIISKILKPNGKVLMTLDTKINNVENYLNNMIKSLEKYNFVVENINRYDTFIFLEISIKKRVNEKEINEIYIYHPNIEGEGITEYTKVLKKRLQKLGIKVFDGLAKPGSIQLIEYERSLNIDLNLFEKGSYIEIHSEPPTTPRKDLIYLMHVPHAFPANWYYVPHIAYEIEPFKKEKKYDWCSFGFSMVFKHYEKIIFLKGKKKLVISINKLLPNKYYLYFLRFLKIFSRNLNIVSKDYFLEDELISELSECKAFVFFQDSRHQSSGTMRFAAAFGVPVYAKDSYQARESQVIRFRSIKELKSPYIIKDSINIDDGLDYLLSVLKYT